VNFGLLPGFGNVTVLLPSKALEFEKAENNDVRCISGLLGKWLRNSFGPFQLRQLLGTDHIENAVLLLLRTYSLPLERVYRAVNQKRVA
jgi:hypothetical protein